MVSILEYVPEYSSQIQKRDVHSRDEQTEDVKMNPGLVLEGNFQAGGAGRAGQAAAGLGGG